MSVKLAFYKTPAQAAALGTTVTETVSINQSQATVIRNYYQALESRAAISIGALVSAATTLLTSNFRTAFQVGASVASGIITSTVVNTYFGDLADMFDAIDNDNDLEFIATYKYKQKGSNDGAYWLTNMEMKVNY